MGYQRYKSSDYGESLCRSCRNKGRICNKCWSFSIGRPSTAECPVLEPVPGNSSRELGPGKYEVGSYRRILPKGSEVGAFERKDPCVSPKPQSEQGLVEPRLVQTLDAARQENDRGVTMVISRPSSPCQDQSHTSRISFNTLKTPHIHILIPPMDELGKAVQFIVTQHDRFVSQLALFKPRNTRFCLNAKRTATQLQNSHVMHWLLFLMCIIYREILDGNERIYKTHHINWVNRFEQRIASKMAAMMGPVTPTDNKSQLINYIEVSLLKHEVTETIVESYACLRSCSLSFLEIAFSEPALWTSKGTSMSISLIRALSSTRGEINRFACMDVMAALALGLPTLAMYDASLDGLDTPVFHSMEYIHGCPSEFLAALVEVHNWRMQYPEAVCNQEQWQLIEERIMSMHQSHDEADTRTADSAQLIIRLAVRESWRHAALIYLYLVMCGARSDDARIQSSVRQILKLIDNIRPDTSYTTFFFLQYLFAGICAQKEQHRHSVMSRYLTPTHIDWGLLRVSQFAKVLDHLWHGAATDGRAVTWKDYLNSRCATIPISI
ncbi:hypothetical protein RSOLAG1IB_06852 [Rhizoctonia solani AG-1 IB]|uniref:Fungal zn(2)-Cys(6) binuclear cluster domain-containing protein n=1 Tax=Thanatephorus cucumeris (strain AG1-IB / isolate 7/3/14) TaxID=1108050 RepID=A0A0B7F7X1_THACB|nr:hypothetical protein RSOLAG1IB_06852 [Rhizoctonia solani AG-1 IB]